MKTLRYLLPAALLGLSLLVPGVASAQNGTVLGLIFDASTGNPIHQATVAFEGTDVKAVTSPDGSYTVELPAGAYQLTISAPKYLTATVENLVVVAGDVVDGSAVMATQGAVTTVEVTAKIDAQKATAESVTLARKLSASVSDAVSAEEISKSTASDAAGALEKVTGVSVVGDGFVYVRGLGERYSATMLNNALITTTEPEKRVVPLDLFPANLIDKLEVIKTYSADLPGEFSGGLVKMQTVEFPTQRILQLSMSTSFNTQTTGKDFYTYPGGGNDFFGFDDGSRSLPADLPRDERLFRGDFSDDELASFGRSFDPNWETLRRSSARPSQSYSLLLGDSFGKLGVIGAVTFSNKLSRYPEVFRTFNSTRLGEQAQQTNYEDFRADTETARLGGVLNFAYRFSPKHKLAVRNTLTKDADKEGRYFSGLDGGTGNIISNERLRWVEREMFATQIEGEHLTGVANSVFTWQLGYSRANRDEPDLREVTRVGREDGSFAFASNPDSGIRFFSDLEDRLWEPTADFSIPFFSGSVVGSFDVGFRATFRQRDFAGRRFRYIIDPRSGLDRSLGTNTLLARENIADNVVEFREITRGTDTYSADMNIYGGYFNVDLAFSPKWRVIGGVRFEDFEENVTTIDPLVPGAIPDTSQLAKRDPLPAISLVYSPTSHQNLRFGYGKTLSRPDFRELSPFSFTDIIGGFSTNGNPNLRRAAIQNFDVRWEMFFGGDQLAAVSYFYKDFTDPIEMVLQPGGNQRRTWINAAGAKNQGIELEYRRNLAFLNPSLAAFSFSSNLTLVDSEIVIPEDSPFPLTNPTRPLMGQSRYLFNGAVEWAKPRWRSNTRLFVGYYSSRISEVGANNLQDVIDNGRTTLDAVYEFTLREQGDYKLRFNAENLTDEDFLWTQGGDVKRLYRQGRTFSVGLSFSILE